MKHNFKVVYATIACCGAVFSAGAQININSDSDSLRFDSAKVNLIKSEIDPYRYTLFVLMKGISVGDGVVSYNSYRGAWYSLKQETVKENCTSHPFAAGG
ncbi:MAG: hypothetical protein JXA18_06730 [Chitinispirillaceae bacterium]|nr:hypothetical protein [Chitinispirillaceae bacterium]